MKHSKSATNIRKQKNVDASLSGQIKKVYFTPELLGKLNMRQYFPNIFDSIVERIFKFISTNYGVLHGN